MAGRGKPQPGTALGSYEGFDKLTSSTLKRHPKMELSKADLLKLLSVLEGELQAREVVIAVLKAEQVKQLLYPRGKGGCGGPNGGGSGGDPWASLQRDVLKAYDGRFDAASVRALHGLQLCHLEHLIALHRRVQGRTREDLRALEQRCAKLCRELDEERGKRVRDAAQGDDVTFLLEKEREHLRQEIDYERQQKRRLEKDLQQVGDSLELERSRQKQMVLLLLGERKRLILRLIQERQRGDQLLQSLQEEKARSADMVEGLEEESKRSLQMEEEMERQAADFELERERFQAQVPPKPAPDRTPPKKAGPPSVGGASPRPTPPPVPPNKPVLQRKDLGPKPPVPPRSTPELADFQSLLVSMATDRSGRLRSGAP
ncbi:conserved hypothetical protein [Ixodes scapularis]|uniref:Cortactin-binding protein-2 N-terminal domain-containing protein n=1 Tax=Ixodes scapularis TaxID=6945 RepID=B7PGS8_IXOSC|nr:conserved hypothetical protein [Ixodes scapularis]|eukprot:XP_002401437.1 conserved hypothetical protein [Ixodes scapularis]